MVEAIWKALGIVVGGVPNVLRHCFASTAHGILVADHIQMPAFSQWYRVPTLRGEHHFDHHIPLATVRKMLIHYGLFLRW